MPRHRGRFEPWAPVKPLSYKIHVPEDGNPTLSRQTPLMKVSEPIPVQGKQTITPLFSIDFMTTVYCQR